MDGSSKASFSFLQERYTAQPRNSEVFNSLCDVPRSELIRSVLGCNRWGHERYGLGLNADTFR